MALKLSWMQHEIKVTENLNGMLLDNSYKYSSSTSSSTSSTYKVTSYGLSNQHFLIFISLQ